MHEYTIWGPMLAQHAGEYSETEPNISHSTSDNRAAMHNVLFQIQFKLCLFTSLLRSLEVMF